MRRLLILLAALVVALAGALLFVRQSLLQDELREAVEARLSRTLGQPVSIGSLGFSVTPRVAVTGRDVVIGSQAVTAPALGVGSIRILPQLRPLFSGDVVIDDVELTGLEVAVLRDDEGRWHLPAAMPAPTGESDGGLVVERVSVADARVRIFERGTAGDVTERGAIDALHAALTSDADVVRLSSIRGRIGSASVLGEARVSPDAVDLELSAEAISDDDLPAFLGLIGAERPDVLRLAAPATLAATLRMDRASAALSGTGTIRAPEVVVDPLRLQQLESPFTLEGSRLSFAPARFTLYDGAHEGTLRVDLARTPAAWTMDGRLTGLNAGAFLNTLNGSDQRLDGTASMDAALAGSIGEPLTQTVRGRARIDVADGVIRDFPLLAAINKVVRVAGQAGPDTRFERLSATLDVASGAATTDDLVLELDQLRVEAAGRIGADRSVDLRGVAILSRQRAADAVARVRELARLRNADGEMALPLTITGTLDDPSFGIDVAAALKRGLADELRRRLRRIIR